MAPTSPTKASNTRTLGFLALSGTLALYIAAILLLDRDPSLDSFLPTQSHLNPEITPTDETHIAFAVLGSRRSISRRPFVELWWRPNRTRGLIWLDPSQQQDPWPPSSPPFRLFQPDVPVPVQMKRVLEETLLLGGESPPRWVVLGDDDTVFFVDNLVDVLRRYDHRRFYYIGGESESAIQNSRYYGMAFGGGGVALSARLVAALLPALDKCLERYQGFYILDKIFHSCISDVGVSLTREQGFHQLDLRGNVSGFLSAHPQAPVVSLHHVELVEPVIPGLTREAALGRVMAAARTDSSRLLQQSFCYAWGRNWTFAVSFGYSVHLHERTVEPRVLQQPLQTFRAWRKAIPPFSFETRQWWRDACSAPHEFYADGVEEQEERVVSRYVRFSARDLPLCGNYSANGVETISVITPRQRRIWIGGRRECCDVVNVSKGGPHALLRVRPCLEGETIYYY